MPKYISPSGKTYFSNEEVSPEDLDSLFKGDDNSTKPPEDTSILGRVKSAAKGVYSSAPVQRMLFGPTAQDKEGNRNSILDNASPDDKTKIAQLEKNNPNFKAGQVVGMPSDKSVLPKANQPTTYSGGFANSLYNDFVRPLASPAGVIGSMALGGKRVPTIDPSKVEEAIQATRAARSMAGLDRPTPRLALPPMNPDSAAEYPQSPLAPRPNTTFIGGPSGESEEVLPVGPPSPNTSPLAADTVVSPNPTNAATIAGMSTEGKPGNLGSVADLNDLAEQRRIAGLKYTAAQQYPGTRMTLPDRPVMDTPTSSGDTRLGFSGTSSKLGDYPLNVVPERLQPRVSQSTTANLTPDRMKINSIPEDSEMSFTSGGVENPNIPTPKKPDFNIGDPDAPYQLPSAERSSQPRQIATPKDITEPPVVLEGKAKSIVEKTNEVGNSDLTNIVGQEMQKPSFLDTFNKSLVKRGYDSLFTTVETQLKNLNPNLAMTARRAQIDGDALAAQLKNAYHKVVDGLSDEDWNSVQSILDGKSTGSQSKTVTDSANKIRSLLDSVSMQARDVNLGMKTSEGKVVPLAYRQDYFPHTYDPEFLSTLKNDPTKVRDLLAKEGKAPAEIDDILANSRRFGERILNAQNAREANLSGYKTDRNVLDTYFHSMGRRIEQARNFGPMDIADVNSPAMQMVRASKDPEKAADLMKIITGRTEPPSKVASEISDKITSASAALHLSTSALSHINAPQFILLQSSTKNFIKGLTSYISDAKAAGELAKNSGALENIRTALTGAPESFKLTDYYGLAKAQTLPRTWAAVTGRLEASEAFDALKENPTNTTLQSRLKNLVLEDPLELLKQDELNEKQLNRASGRMAQLSQGLSDKLDKPPTWNGPMAKVMTQFHNYAMSQSANTWNAIKANPVRNIPLIAATMLVSGEISGDSKAALKGLVKGTIGGKPIEDMQNEIASRGNWMSAIKNHPDLQRLMENVFQSWALGIPLDVAKAAGSGGNAVLGLAAGPSAQDAVKGIDDTKSVLKGNMRPISMDALSKVPFIGPGLAASVPRRNPTLRP